MPPPPQGCSIDDLREMPPIKLVEFLGAEFYRVANATRVDVTQLSADVAGAERAAVLRAAAGAGGEEPLSGHERMLTNIESLWDFEADWRGATSRRTGVARARSAPGAHMEPEWGGRALT